MKITATLLTIFLCFNISAQTLKPEVYAGTMDGNMPITIYLQPEEHPCSMDTIYEGMYLYDGKSKWIQLNITKNEQNQFVLVEYGFTGVMVLSKKGKELNGIWISPNGKRQLKVTFKKTKIPTKRFEDKFEKVNYENYDC